MLLGGACSGREPGAARGVREAEMKCAKCHKKMSDWNRSNDGIWVLLRCASCGFSVCIALVWDYFEQAA